MGQLPHALPAMTALFIYGSQAADEMSGCWLLINGLVKGTSPGLSPGLSALTALGVGLPPVRPVGGPFLVPVLRSALMALEGDSSWLDGELALGAGFGFSCLGQS